MSRFNRIHYVVSRIIINLLQTRKLNGQLTETVDRWTFISGQIYPVRPSIIHISEENIQNTNPPSPIFYHRLLSNLSNSWTCHLMQCTHRSIKLFGIYSSKLHVSNNPSIDTARKELKQRTWSWIESSLGIKRQVNEKVVKQF